MSQPLPPRLRLHVEHLAPATGRKQDIRPGEVYTFTSLLAAENTPFKPRTLRLECNANAFEVESIRVGHEEQLLRRPVPLWFHSNRLIELPVVRAGEVIALRVRNTSDATVTFIGQWSGDCLE